MGHRRDGSLPRRLAAPAIRLCLAKGGAPLTARQDLVPERAREDSKIRWGHARHLERRGTHVLRAVDPRNRNLADAVPREQRLESKLRICGEMRLLDVQVLQNLRSVC